MQQGSKTAVPRRASREQARGIRVIVFCSSALEVLAEDCASSGKHRLGSGG